MFDLKKNLKKEDLNFNVLFFVCFIISIVFVLRSNILDEFKDHQVFLWFIITFAIFGLSLFFTFFFLIGYQLILYFVLEMKKLIIKQNYLQFSATLIGSLIFVMMIFPIVKIAILIIIYTFLNIKINY